MVDLHWIRFCGYGFMSLIVCLINICICRLEFVPAEKEALFYQVPEYLFLFVVFGLSITLCMSAFFSSFYMNQHSKASTRRWHFAGTLFSILLFFCSLLFSWWFLLLVPFSGYGCAFYSHLFVERNFPEDLRHPFWSLLCDFKMFGFMLTGNMDREIKRLGKRPVLQVFWFLC